MPCLPIKSRQQKETLIIKSKNICKQKINKGLINLVYLNTFLFFLLVAFEPVKALEDNQINQVLKEQSQIIEFKEKKVPQNNLDLKEIEKQADFASQVTGVRKDFLMGMLVVESNLGKNTGKCTYKEVSEGARSAYQKGLLSKKTWNNFQKQEKIVKDIANELDYDYEKLKVSCNPNYSGTGGAMGIPQFMPTTWMEYKDEIAQIVGVKNPDPWNVRHGVVAMALKVADVSGVTEHDVSAERRASKMYLSGSTSSRYEWYASQIQYWARNYDELIG